MFALSGAAGRWRRPAVVARTGVLGPLAAPALRAIVLVTVVQGFAVGLVQVTSAAAMTAAGEPGRSGMVYAALTAGSLLGTILYGIRARPCAARWQVPALLVGMSGSLVGAAVAPGVGFLSLTVFVFGLLVGPLAVRCFLDLERAAPVGSPASSVTVLIAAGLVATSVGAVLAGWAVDTSGRATPLLAGAGCTAAAALWAQQRTRR